eukprot:4931715-Amphidinium_carterae.1
MRMIAVACAVGDEKGAQLCCGAQWGVICKPKCFMSLSCRSGRGRGITESRKRGVTGVVR